MAQKCKPPILANCVGSYIVTLRGCQYDVFSDFNTTKELNARELPLEPTCVPFRAQTLTVHP